MRELTDLEKGVQAYEMQEIKNLMARYEYYHTAKMHRQTLDLFAQHTPGVYIDNSSLGRYEGLKGVEEFFVKFHELLDGDKKGSLCIHPITTEMLEIARDGKTARGLWILSGNGNPCVQCDRRAFGLLGMGEISGRFCQGRRRVEILAFLYYRSFPVRLSYGMDGKRRG